MLAAENRLFAAISTTQGNCMPPASWSCDAASIPDAA